MDVLPEAGGWVDVLNKFETDHIPALERWPSRLMVLILDFDGHIDRLTTAQNRIPQHLKERVFIIGVLTNPEELRQGLGISYENIGNALASDCRDDTSHTWGHALLVHNSGEVQRMSGIVRQLLFI